MKRRPRRRAADRGGRARSDMLRIGAVAALLLLPSAGLLRLLQRTAPAGLDPVGGPWTLTDGDGRRVSDRDLRGRFVLIYFGYASCPDVCPTTLGAVAEAMSRLGERAERVQPIFITIDPGHDTARVVGRFAASFGARVIGLTGTASQIHAVEREFRVLAVTRPVVAGDGGYTIDHTSVLLLMGPDGRFVAPLSATDSGEAIASHLARYVGAPPDRS